MSSVSSVVENAWAWIGLAIMLVSEAATLARIEPFWSWNTPIAWTGFIVFADAMVFRTRGDSWMRSSPREFVALTLASIPLWIVFEGYNLVIRNWYYVGLPEDFWLRQFGYGWSFATIWPAIFEGAELIALWRGVAPLQRHPTYDSLKRRPVDATVTHVGSGFSRAGSVAMVAGALMLVSPFFVPPAVAQYLAAPVWLGFILLLDPINARLGAESLTADLTRDGNRDRLVNLLLSGFLCGGLWEFWNYWSRAKWHYTVPIMERYKIFEMPVPGYIGFAAFALECFTMYVFVRRLFTPLGRRIAL